MMKPGDTIEFIANGQLGVVRKVTVNETGAAVVVWRELFVHMDASTHYGATCSHTADKMKKLDH